MRRDTILVIDFGSQYTQLICRRIRELKVFSRIVSCYEDLSKVNQLRPKGIILSGGPLSVYDRSAPQFPAGILDLKVPVLGICYGAQLVVKHFAGKVKPSKKREFGRTSLKIESHKDLFFSLPPEIISWMSHSDSIAKVSRRFQVLARTKNAPYAAFKIPSKDIYGVQFHPEVEHTESGIQIISNFLFRICDCYASWDLEDFIKEEVRAIRRKVKKGRVVCALSGGVDSSVTAALVHKAIGSKLKCIFVNNGLLRKNESREVLSVFRGKMKMDVSCADARRIFLKNLQGVVDPEEKRKIIGRLFIDVFEKEAAKIKNVKYLAQGTLYPDVIESVSPFGSPTSKIKSHHNVGGLPETMKLKLIEPLRFLFKDEVRVLGRKLKIPEEIISRQPFPGPGLAVRIVGDVTTGRLSILREADRILQEEIKKFGLEDRLWQGFCILLPIKSVGVMGDMRTYEYVCGVRMVSSSDGMTADWIKPDMEFLDRISTRIINETRGVNRVVYDISSKPPATIEWE